MTTVCAGIEKAAGLSSKFLSGAGGDTEDRHPRIREIISGIILLAARADDPIPLAKVHSILHAMKSHESIFSGLSFSLTGAVCYSRDIDHAINRLTDGGFLDVAGGSAFAGERAREFVGYLSGFLTDSQVQAVHSVSLRFHDRLRREVMGPGDLP